MADLDCKIVLPEVPLDVGRKFDLLCTSSKPIDVAQLEGKNFSLAEKEKYVLKLLSVRSQDNELRLTVTSYQTGKHDLNSLQIENLKINPIQFEVKSLQDPKEPRQQPYDLIGAMTTSLPWYFWAGWILLIVILIGVVIVWFRQKRKIKLYIAEANEAMKAKPDKFIYQNVRQLLRQRSLNANDQDRNKSDLFKIRNFYLLYLTVKLEIPFLYWRLGKAIKKIKKTSLSEKTARKTAEIVRELHLLVYKNSKKDYSSQDIEQMIQVVKKNVDEIETLKQVNHGL